MNIQILGSPRSGTTSFYEGLRDSINYTVGIFEPISLHLNYRLFSKSDEEITNHISRIKNSNMNVVEKNVIVPFIEKEAEERFEFYLKYLKNFDKVILITREDIEDHAKSYKTAITTDNWHFPYQDVDIDYEDKIPVLQRMDDLLQRLSKNLKVPLLKYEMLYSDNIDYLREVAFMYNFNFDDSAAFYTKFSTDRRHRKFI